MPSFTGAVYDPPHEGLPTLTVAFGADGNVIIARCMRNRQEAETLLAQIKHSIQAAIDKETGSGA